MPRIMAGGLETYYEIHGAGNPLVFIHGGWVSRRMWSPQVEHFSPNYRVLVYDVRGHGDTGPSPAKKYSMELFAEDLRLLLDELQIEKPVLIGLSMGGMIAQCFAVKYPHRLRALVLADTAASTELTLSDKIVKYLLAPKWVFLLMVRLLGVKKYVDFAFWFARVTRSKEWVGQDPQIPEYEKREMLQFGVDEFNKIFAALYAFKLQPLEKIIVPTLIINGEHESRSVLKHTRFMQKVIPQAQMVFLPDAGHTSNLENAVLFNQALERFIESLHPHGREN